MVDLADHVHNVDRLASLLLVQCVDVDDSDHVEAMIVILKAIVTFLALRFARRFGAHQLAEHRDLTVATLKVQVLDEVFVMLCRVQLMEAQPF